MKYLILTLAALALCLVTAGPVLAWEPPEDCDDAQRMVSGNRSTPCKLVFPEVIEDVTYSVEMEYPYCVEELTFPLPGARPLSTGRAPIEIQALEFVSYEQGTRGSYEYWKNLTERRDAALRVSTDHLHVQGYAWVLDSAVGEPSYFSSDHASTHPLSFDLTLEILSGHAQRGWYEIQTPEAPMPDVSGVRDLVNACLALLAQEKADRDHAAQVARDEAATAAQLQAERDATKKEEEQAQREAEAQARIAEAEFLAALETKEAVARAELIKTQTLEAQLKHEAAIAEILRDIVQIRLAGDTDRAYLTNEYLAELAIITDDFEAETVKAEELIREYTNFNADLLASIDGYWQAVDARLQRVSESVSNQLDKIAEIEAEAAQIAEDGEEAEELESE